MVESGSSGSKQASRWSDEDLREWAQRDRFSRRWYRRRGFLFFILACAFLVWFIPFVPALYLPSITVTRLDAKGKSIDVSVGPNTKNWIGIEKVSRHVVNAVVVAEDAKFYQHMGFDFEAISNAIEVNRKRGRYARGGSTISQQVVKIAFLSREKTIIRKAREAAGTLLLELLMPKDKILEWYINLCEFGGGVYGVKAAGLHYFKTRPELLTIEQAVNLAIVIPSPNKWSAGLRAKSLTPFGQRRFTRIVRNLYLAGYITDVQQQTALARGNFGQPIQGFEIQDGGDEDDCRGERDCAINSGDENDQVTPLDAAVVDLPGGLSDDEMPQDQVIQGPQGETEAQGRSVSPNDQSHLEGGESPAPASSDLESP